jgi:hypothetical protein
MHDKWKRKLYRRNLSTYCVTFIHGNLAVLIWQISGLTLCWRTCKLWFSRSLYLKENPTIITSNKWPFYFFQSVSHFCWKKRTTKKKMNVGNIVLRPHQTCLQGDAFPKLEILLIIWWVKLLCEYNKNIFTEILIT